MLIRRTIIAVEIACCLSAPQALAGDLQRGISSMLDGNANTTPAAVARIRDEFGRLKRDYPKDSRVDYAYALVLANQHKYREATPLVSNYLETAPNDMVAHRLKIFLLLQAKKYSDALQHASVMSQHFPNNSHRIQEDDYFEAAEFLGTLFGYLELVRPAVTNPQLRLERRNEIAGRMRKRLVAFDRGRNVVATEFAHLQKSRVDEQERATTTEERRRDRARTNLEKDRKELSEHEKRIQSSEYELGDAQRELSTLQSQLGSLQNDRTRLGAQLISGQAQLSQLLTPQERSLNVTDRVITNPKGDRWTHTQTDSTSTSVSFDRAAQALSLSFNLAALNKQAFDMDRKILALQAKVAEATGRGNEGLQAREKSTAAIREAEKRAKIAERQLRQRTPTSNARIAAINAKMTNFATYAPFPFEQEKQRVLSWFAK